MSVKGMSEKPEKWVQCYVPEEEIKLGRIVFESMPSNSVNGWVMNSKIIPKEEAHKFFEEHNLRIPDDDLIFSPCHYVPHRKTANEPWRDLWNNTLSDDEAEEIWIKLGLPFPGKNGVFF